LSSAIVFRTDGAEAASITKIPALAKAVFWGADFAPQQPVCALSLSDEKFEPVVFRARLLDQKMVVDPQHAGDCG
jgi:hypothetical protein